MINKIAQKVAEKKEAKYLRNRGNNINFEERKKKFLENKLAILIIGFPVLSLVYIIFCSSFFFFFGKTYKTYTQDKYIAEIIENTQEKHQTRSGPKRRRVMKIFYNPKIKYTNNKGQEIITHSDKLSTNPIPIGTKLRITVGDAPDEINQLPLPSDWLESTMFVIVSGVISFFTYLITSYTTNYSFEVKIKQSLIFSLSILIINTICTLYLHFS